MPFWAKTTIDQNNNFALPIFVIVYILYSISIFPYSLSLTQWLRDENQSEVVALPKDCLTTTDKDNFSSP
jgi:hypothetical protein